jgi:hypothetical protein
LNLAKYQRRAKSLSGFQGTVGGLLADLYPLDIILEEVSIPGERFVLDYLVPSAHVVVECQGTQHDEFVPYFHGTRQNFHAQQDRDSRKRRWCELNNLHLIEIPYGRSESEILAILGGKHDDAGAD